LYENNGIEKYTKIAVQIKMQMGKPRGERVHGLEEVTEEVL
jgi:hypothetical protein